jgi:hypothetical protein
MVLRKNKKFIPPLLAFAEISIAPLPREAIGKKGF